MTGLCNLRLLPIPQGSFPTSYAYSHCIINVWDKSRTVLNRGASKIAIVQRCTGCRARHLTELFLVRLSYSLMMNQSLVRVRNSSNNGVLQSRHNSQQIYAYYSHGSVAIWDTTLIFRSLLLRAHILCYKLNDQILGVRFPCVCLRFSGNICRLIIDK